MKLLSDISKGLDINTWPRWATELCCLEVGVCIGILVSRGC